MSVLDKKVFERLRKNMEKSDERREKLIKQSRDVLKLSKGAIYSVHRGEIDRAKKSLDSAKARLKALRKFLSKENSVGAYHDAVQEYVEARCYLGFMTKGKLPGDKELGVSQEDYLLGLCDVTGELVRRGINAAIKGEYQQTIDIKDAVAQIYAELMRFDFRNSSLRRKFDSIKYDLGKLEDVVLRLKLKER